MELKYPLSLPVPNAYLDRWTTLSQMQEVYSLVSVCHCFQQKTSLDKVA